MNNFKNQDWWLLNKSPNIKKNIDFIIPCHPKDFPSLKLCVDGIKKISSHRNIFVISKEDLEIEGVTFIPENKFDKFVTKDKIKNIWREKNESLVYRSKWIYQQFLKLLSFKVIENLSDSFVLVDSDTIFLKDIEFDSNKFYYCKATEYHHAYLNPIKILLNVDQTIGFSCIAHHMIYNKEKLSMMINEIENKFNDTFANIVLNIIDYNESSGLCEQDLYANYMLLKHSEMCQQRQLTWHNISYIPTDEIELNHLSKDFDFVSCHAYFRGIQ